jgi:hypothetical protein
VKVLRARGFFLSLEGGERLCDLALDGGRAVLGHKRRAPLRALKNAAERGLFAPYPHPAAARFDKALSCLLPGRVFRVYAPGTDAAALLEAAGCGAPLDPAFGWPHAADSAPPCALLWRPFLDWRGGAAPPFAAARALVPVLHEPLGLCVIALDPASPALERLPPSHCIAPAWLEMALAAARDLAEEVAHPSREALPRVEAAIAAPGSPWRRRGIYVTPKDDDAAARPGAWQRLSRALREAGFLIPPSPRAPLILPAALSAGLDARLGRALGVCSALTKAH